MVFVQKTKLFNAEIKTDFDNGIGKDKYCSAGYRQSDSQFDQ